MKVNAAVATRKCLSDCDKCMNTRYSMYFLNINWCRILSIKSMILEKSGHDFGSFWQQELLPATLAATNWENRRHMGST